MPAKPTTPPCLPTSLHSGRRLRLLPTMNSDEIGGAGRGRRNCYSGIVCVYSVVLWPLLFFRPHEARRSDGGGPHTRAWLRCCLYDDIIVVVNHWPYYHWWLRPARSGAFVGIHTLLTIIIIYWRTPTSECGPLFNCVYSSPFTLFILQFNAGDIDR